MANSSDISYLIADIREYHYESQYMKHRNGFQRTHYRRRSVAVIPLTVKNLDKLRAPLYPARRRSNKLTDSKLISSRSPKTAIFLYGRYSGVPYLFSAVFTETDHDWRSLHKNRQLFMQGWQNQELIIKKGQSLQRNWLFFLI